MATAALDFRPATVDVVARPGDDINWRVIISDSSGQLLDLTGATVTVTVGSETPTVAVTDPGIVDITLSDTQTTNIGAASVAWSLKVTLGSQTTTYAAGNYTGTLSGNTNRNLTAAVVCTSAAVMVQTIAGGAGSAGSGATELEGLSDVDLTSPVVGHILRHDGTQFVNVLGTSFFQAADSDLAAIAALSTTSFGRSLLTLADASAGRTALSLAAVAASGAAADITGLAAVATTGAASSLTGLAAIATSGSATDLSAGTVAAARLGSGSPSSSTFLRGDNTWATPTASVAFDDDQIFNAVTVWS